MHQNKVAWRLKHKTIHHKTLRRKYRQNILWHWLYKCVLMAVSQGNRNINKNKPMGPSQTHKFLHSKANHKKNQKYNQEWEKIITDDMTNGEFISKIHKQHICNPIKKKWDKDWTDIFLKKDVKISHRHLKIYSTSLIIREMQIKTQMWGSCNMVEE